MHSVITTLLVKLIGSTTEASTEVGDAKFKNIRNWADNGVIFDRNAGSHRKC
jgi:hypothetical protein